MGVTRLSAATKYWDSGGTAGSWNSANNWNSNGVPGSGDDLIFDNTYVATLPSTISLGGNRSANSFTIDTSDALAFTNGTGNRTLSLTSGNLTRTADSAGAHSLGFTNLDLLANGTFAIDGADTLTISAVIRNSGGARSINRTGAGTLLLSGNNSFSGGLTLTSGLTLLGHNAAAGTGTLTFAGGTIGASGSSRTIANAVSASSTIIIGGASDITFTGAFNLGAGNRTLQIDNTGTTRISGAVSNSYYATTTKTGDGTLILSGNNSSLQGPMAVAQGTLQIESNNALGGSNYGNSVSAGATLALAGGAGSLSISEGAFDLSGYGAGGNGALRNLSGTNTLTATLNLLGATRIQVDAGSLTVGGLSPAGFALEIDGSGAFTSTGALNSGGDLSLLGSGDRSFGAAVNLGSNSLSIQSSGTNTFSGAVTANGGISITSGANTFSNTLASSATLALGSASSTTASGTVQVGTLEITGTAGATFTGSVSATTGGISITSTGSVAFNGSQATAGTQNFTVDTSANVALGTAVIAGTFSKNGSGTTTFSGSAANQIANTFVNAGTLVLNKTAGTNAISGNLTVGDGLGTDTVSFSAANQINDNSAVALLSSGVLNLNSFSDTINSLAFTGGSVATGAGTLTITNANSITGNASGVGATISGNLALPSYSSTINVAEGLADADLTISANISGNRIIKTGDGTLVLSGSNTFADGGQTYDNALSIQGGTVLVTADANLGNANNNVAFNNGGRLQIGGTITAGAGRQFNFTGAGTIDVTSGNTATLNGILDGAGAFTKSGEGTLTLGGTAANTLSGAVSIDGGTLALAKTAGTNAIASNVTVNSGGTLRLDANNQIADTATVGFGSSGTAIFNVNSRTETIAGLSGSNTSASVTMASGGSLTVGSSANASFAGSITGTGTLTKVGTGTQTLGANSFTGSVNINAGTLLASANNILTVANALTVASGATLDLASYSAAVATIAGSGTIAIGNGGSLAVGGTNANSTFAGTLTGTGTLQKVGTGDLTFTSSINFGGQLTLSGGEVTLAGISATIGTLHITGNTILDFGNSAASTLNITHLIIDPGATLTITNWVNLQDYFFVNGTFVQFGGPSATPGMGQGTAPLNQITFAGWSGSNTGWQTGDHQITPTPEPATYGALLLAGTFGIIIWRRRKASAPPAIAQPTSRP